MSIRLQLPTVTDLKPRITVLGVGGAGGNAINNMIAAGLQGVNFVVANTDAQALATSSADNRIQLGTNLTEGMGAGSKPEIGEAAAEEAVDDIRAQVAGSHMLFIAAGMGGGTGTGAAAIIARVARELGILTVAVVTKPFQFEGKRRLRIAEAGIAQLKDAVDTLIVIPNQNLFRIANERTTFAEAFVLADQVLYSGIACIVDLIIKEGLINLDLADVKTVLAGMGAAMMGTGEASGADRARLAAEEAIQNPLLDDISLKGAKGLLVSIIGGHDLTLYEVDAAASRVRQEVDPEANIIVGATFDETLGDRVRVSIVASGMTRSQQSAPQTQSTAPTQPQVGTPHTVVVAAPATPAKMPPPLPGTTATTYPPPLRDAADLERRMADAAEPGTGYAAQFEGQIGALLTRSSDSSQSSPTQGVEAHRLGDITIEERTPKVPSYIAAPAPSGHGASNESEYGTGRDRNTTTTPSVHTAPRMPDISDFPPLAQHEFRSRTENSGAHNNSKPPKVYANTPQPAAPRKPTLIQRLTGTGRVQRANASDVEPTVDAELPGFLSRNKR